MQNLMSFADSMLNKDDTMLPKVTADAASLQDILLLVFGIAGAIAFLVVVIAGFQFVISGGDPQKVAKARQTILFAVVGLVVCSAAFTIVKLVVGSV